MYVRTTRRFNVGTTKADIDDFMTKKQPLVVQNRLRIIPKCNNINFI